MADAEVGDIVLSYANGKVSYFGVVVEEASTAHKPSEFGAAGDVWDNDGWFLPISWQKISPSIQPKLIWDEIQHLFPQKYSPLNGQGGGNQGCYLAEISEQIFLTLMQYSLEKNPILFSTIQKNLATTSSALRRQITEVKRTVSQRIGQLQFRNKVIKLEGACPITGVASPAFLRASHIKPWRVCETAEERLDPYNGLALAPHIDQLFDQGYITFDTSGSLILSDECPPMIPIQWGFEEKISQSLIEVNSKRSKYINYHNRHVFKH
tara:strand:- start:246 stop:1043 length:798 start_codon:yes stop_codon:yes gene_type:complete